MKRVVASLCVCWAAFCGTQSNIAPLNFGMTPEEVSSALAPIMATNAAVATNAHVRAGSASAAASERR